MISSNNLTLTGIPADVDETVLDLESGWNWIGYTPQVALDVNTALGNIPEGNAEFLKSQSGYADFYTGGYGWFGTLQDMRPYLGYLLRLAEDTSFTYNESMLSSVSSVVYSEVENNELNIHDYEHNGTLTTAIYVDNDRVDSYDYELRAYNGRECVGYAEGLYFPLDGNVIFPLMVYGNDAGNTLSFEVYNKTTDEYLNVEEEFVFSPDMKLGDGYDPVVLNTAEQPVESSISAAYPNPFNPVVNFDIDLDGNHYVDARVYNIAGQEVAVLHDGLLSGSAQTLSWMATNQSSGIYFIRIVVDGMTTVNNKVILLK